MPTQRTWLISIFLSLAAVAAPAAWAVGFEADGSGVAFGQPLGFSVQLRLDVDAPLEPACVRAEVTMGERKLPDTQVRTRVQMTGAQQARVHVSTTSAIEEPVLSVDLAVGCGSRIARRFVLFADPPQEAPTAAPALAAAAAPMALAAAPASEPAGGVPGVAPGAGPSGIVGLAGFAAPASTAPGLAPPPAAARTARNGRAARNRQARLAGSGGRALVLAAVASPESPSGTDRPARAPRRAAAAGPASRPAVPAGQRRAPPARLQLEMMVPAGSPEDEVVEQALQAVALAASSARAAAAAASAAALRMGTLESTVEQLRAENKTQSEAVAQWRERMARAEAAGQRAQALMWVAGVLGLLAGWLAWRVNSLQRERLHGWRLAAARAEAPGAAAAAEAPGAAAAAGAPGAVAKAGAAVDADVDRLPTPPVLRAAVAAAAPIAVKPHPAPAWPPAVTDDDERVAPSTSPAHARAEVLPNTETLDTPRPAPKAAPKAAAKASPPAAPPASPRVAARKRPDVVLDELPVMQRTVVLTPRSAPGDASPRDVTIEELIDLEQQAEFFSVLGQDESAVDLLVEHLRSTGGGSPLPYLKLLEIHHRRGDRIAYERMRSRFNERFNAYAPEWGDDMHAGHSLEDYTGVLPRLQQVWAHPLDAMAELEALLFRKSRGELFDLPAYREVLFLYSMARDLLDHEAAETGSVDLLLPLSDPGPPQSLHGLLLGLDEGEPSGFGGRPTAPVDFDISAAERGDSLFDGLGDQPERRRR